MAKAKTPAKGGASAEKEVLVVQSKVREYVKAQGDFNIGGDIFEAISSKVEGILKMAVTRAKENGRKTVQGKDI